MAKHIRGVILDVDGTIVDTNDAHAHAWVEAFKRGGYDVSFKQVRSLIGMGGDKLIPDVVGFEKDTPKGKQLNEWWTEIFKEKYLPDAKAFPGIGELARRIHQDGLDIVVASSGEEDIVNALLDRAGVTEYISNKTSSSEVKNSKPDPDIIKAALDKLGFGEDEVVMLGDTPYDIESALKLGIATIALRCGGWNDNDLREAIAVYDDPADLLAHYGESPLGRRVAVGA